MVFTVPGKPQGKGRPRFTHNGGAYTPKATKQYESLIRDCYIKSGGKLLAEDKPIYLKIIACFAPPQSTPKKTQALMWLNKILPLKRPDGDNIIKAVADALNGVAYHDDSQVTDWVVKKRYVPEACLIVRVEELQNIQGDEMANYGITSIKVARAETKEKKQSKSKKKGKKK